MEMNIIGNKIRSSLEYNNMTQQELATKSGISLTSIQRYIYGSRIPKEKTLKQIADALGTTVDFLNGKESIRKDYEEIKRRIERSVSSLSYEQKMELIRLISK